MRPIRLVLQVSLFLLLLYICESVSNAEWIFNPYYVPNQILKETSEPIVDKIYLSMIEECRTSTGAHQCKASVHALSVGVGAYDCAIMLQVKAQNRKSNDALEYSGHVNEWSAIINKLRQEHSTGFEEDITPEKMFCPFCDTV